jgi:hypothetical protein
MSDRFAKGERIIWVDDLGYGPVTSIVESDSGVGYWCTTAPESKKIPTHKGTEYFIWNRDVRKYLNRRLAIPEKEK